MSIPISDTSSRKSLTLVFSSRMMVSLWATRGWFMMCTFSLNLASIALTSEKYILMCFCLLVQLGASQALCLRGTQINGEKLLRAHGLAARIGALGRKADAHGALTKGAYWARAST